MTTWLLVVLVAGTLLVPCTRAGAAAFVWNQSPETGARGDLPSVAAGCPPFGRTAWCAADFRLETHVIIQEIVAWYAPGAGLAEADEAWLWIGPLTGPTPNPTDRPDRHGQRVRIATRTGAASCRITADDLDIHLVPGEYWLSLTPILAGPAADGIRQLPAASRRNRPAALREGCHGGRWVVSPEDVDPAFSLRGRVRETSSADIFTPFERWRRMW